MRESIDWNGWLTIEVDRVKYKDWDSKLEKVVIGMVG